MRRNIIRILAFAVLALILFTAVWKRPNPGQQAAEKTEETVKPVPSPVPEPEPASADPASIRTEREWGRYLTLPTLAEIEDWNSRATLRSPYLAGWIAAEEVGGFVDWFADFRAEYLPCATYCCLANFNLDYSALETRYARVRTDYEQVSGYAGFQKLQDGRMKAILSFWDVYCTDSSGNETVIRAKLVYPENETEAAFGGEGTGAQYLPDYEWQAGKWYRMILHCDRSETTGNTTVAMWAVELESGRETLLCVYDLGAPDVCFRGDVAVFLECFDPKTAGDVRSMEVRNIAVNGTDGRGYALTKGFFSENYEYPGSYRFGADGDTFWLITTGVPDKSGGWQEGEWLEAAG